MLTKNYSTEIANAINRVLSDDEWIYNFDEQKGIFIFNLSVKGKINELNYIIDVRKTDYVVYVHIPFGVDTDDKKTMSAMTEFVCRANYGITCGNFEIDVNDGEIRYKYATECDGIIPSPQMIKNSIGIPANVIKRYENGITAVMFNGANVKEAVENCKKSR